MNQKGNIWFYNNSFCAIIVATFWIITGAVMKGRADVYSKSDDRRGL